MSLRLTWLCATRNFGSQQIKVIHTRQHLTTDPKDPVCPSFLNTFKTDCLQFCTLAVWAGFLLQSANLSRRLRISFRLKADVRSRQRRGDKGWTKLGSKKVENLVTGLDRRLASSVHQVNGSNTMGRIDMLREKGWNILVCGFIW